jgi:hypothetical protein
MERHILRSSLRCPFLVLAALAAVASQAASTGDYWDKIIGNPGTINDGQLVGDEVRSIAAYGNDIFVGGAFTLAGGFAATNVARWNGSTWSALGAGLTTIREDFVGGVVSGLGVIGSDLYATGSFNRSGGIIASNIARWDGKQWWPLQEGLYGRGYALATDGTNLYVTGLFTRAGNVAANHVAKWDGANWSALGAGLSGGSIGPGVVSIAVSGTLVVVGGEFTRAGDVPVHNIAMWDGSKWSAMGNGLPQVVSSLTFHQGELFAGGALLAKWNGNEWKVLTGILGDSTGRARCFASVGEDLYVGASGVTLPGGANLFRIGPGEEISAIGGGIDPCGGVYALTHRSGRLYVGGLFEQAGGIPSRNIGLWHIPRMLAVERKENALSVSWPAADSNLVLEAASTLPSSNWVAVPDRPAELNGRLTVTNAIGSDNQFYRLRQRNGEARNELQKSE